MSNHITIELCKEDRQRLDEVIGFLGLIVGQKYSKQEALAVLDKTAQPEPVTEHPVDEVSPHAAPEPVATISKKENVEPVAEPEANYTKKDVQALVLKLAAPGTGKKDAVKAIVNEYAEKISAIPEEKLNEVMAKLQKLAEEE